MVSRHWVLLCVAGLGCPASSNGGGAGSADESTSASEATSEDSSDTNETTTVTATTAGSSMGPSESGGSSTDDGSTGEPGTAPTVVFHSDWSTALGSSEDALRDTDKRRPWTGLEAVSPNTAVVADTDDIFPTDNVLEYACCYGFVFFEDSDDYIPTPQIGDSIYLRFYRSWVVPADERESDGTHGDYFLDYQTGSEWGPGALGLYWNHQYADDVYLTVSARQGPMDQTEPRYAYSPYELPKFEVFRYELGYTRTGAETYQLSARVFDAAGEMIWSSVEFSVADFVGGETPLPEYEWTSTDYGGAGAGAMRGLKMGLNGWSSLLNDTGWAAWQTAAVAVCLDDWCGPYPIAGVED